MTVTVLDKAAIVREKMGALLAVAQGSVEEPRFIVLEYQGGDRAAGGADRQRASRSTPAGSRSSRPRAWRT